MNFTKNITKKLAGYSAFAAGFLVINKEANAQVVYTDADPDISLHVEWYGDGDDSEYIDINDDGIDDFFISMTQDPGCGYCWGQSIGKIVPLNSNEVSYIVVSAGTNCSYSEINYFDISPFHVEGEIIDAVDNFSNESVLFFRNDGGYGYCFTDFVGSNNFESRFTGLKLLVGGETHYGWIRLSVIGSLSLIVHDYAYENTPDVPITTETLSNPSIIWEEVSDEGNEINGSDIYFNFLKPVGETGTIEYRIICVKEIAAASFNLDNALMLSPDNYKIEIPTGIGNYSNYLNASTLDSDGEVITNNVPYKLFVLSFNDVGAGIDHQLSESSSLIELKTNIDDVDVNITDISDHADASDLNINFEKSSTEIAISEYRILLIKGPTEYLTPEEGLAVPIENTISIIPTDENISYVCEPGAVDTAGNVIEYGIEYFAAVVFVNNGLASDHEISFSDPLTLNGPTGVASNIILSDINNNADATDMLIQFNLSDYPKSIDEYRILIVPSIDAPTFSIENALDITPFNYYEFSSIDTGIYYLNFNPSTNDIHGDDIVEETGYQAFVLSIATEFGTNDTLSLPSNELILHNAPVDIQSETEIDYTITYLNGNIIIDLDYELYTNAHVEIINNVGQMLSSNKIIDQKTIIKVDFPEGIYYLVLNIDGNKKIKTIIQNH